MINFFKKNKRSIVFLCLIIIVLISYCIYNFLHYSILRNQADFIVTLDGKEILIPCNVADLSVAYTDIDQLSGKKTYDMVGVNEDGHITLVAGIPKIKNSTSVSMYPVRLYCTSPNPHIVLTKSRFQVLGLYVSREYSDNASINGVSLKDHKEALFQKFGEPDLTGDMGNDITYFIYYLNASPKATLRFHYSEERKNFESFELMRDRQ